MADHYQRAVELLDTIDDLTSDLKGAYAARASREHIADVHAELSRSLKLADIHATLSVRQAIQEPAVSS